MTDIDGDLLGRMVILRGCNWEQGEIATELGLSESTVSKYLNQVEAESKGADVDPTNVFTKYYLRAVIGRQFTDSLAKLL